MAFLSGMVAVCLYLFAAWNSGRSLWAEYPLHPVRILGVGGVAIFLHLLVLQQQIHGSQGVDLSLFYIISLISWLMALLTCCFSLFRPLISLTALAFPLAACSILASVFLPIPYHPLEQLGHAAETHVLLSIFAYSLYFVAAGLAVLLSLLNHRLKQRLHLPGLKLLPPLQSLESLLFETLAVSWILLTLALVAGFSAVHNIRTEHLVHKVFFSLSAWLIFTTLLIGRYRLGWRGPRAVRLTLAGFFLLLLGFLGSKAVLELVLHID